MNNDDLIINYLTQHSNTQLCDDCLSDILKINPRQQVNQICNKLKKSKQFNFQREKLSHLCSYCNKEKNVNWIEPIQLISEFKEILLRYPQEKTLTLKDNHIAKKIRKLASFIQQAASISDLQYKLKGSPGNGNWAEIPWVALFDETITKTAEKGFYIVYLFQADMQGFYLSLNQGWTHYEKQYKHNDPHAKISQISQYLRNALTSSLQDFPDHSISLNSNGDLGKGYELGHICGKFYHIMQLPTQAELVNDLRNMLGVYRELKGTMGKMSVETFITAILSGELVGAQDEDSDLLDNVFQKSIASFPKTKTPEEPQNKPEQIVSKNGKSRWVRNPSISREALENANFKCELDDTHITFIAQATGNNFVEAHHLIAMKYQGEFENSLDVPGNIISLCPNCHSFLHYASQEDIKEAIALLYSKRKSQLKNFDIHIPESTLMGYYK